MSDLSFLDDVKKDAEEAKTSVPRDEQLGALAAKVQEQMELEDKIHYLEEELSKAKTQLLTLSSSQIPDLMHQLDISTVTMKDGSKIQVNPFYSAKIPETLADQAFDWLEDHGHDGIIKGELIIMYRRPDKQRLGQFLDLAKELGFLTKDKLHVHPMTLKAFVKEQIQEGQELPRDLFGVYTGWTTKITRKK